MIQFVFVLTLILSIFSQTPSVESINNVLFLKYAWIVPGVMLLLSDARSFQSKRVLWMYGFVGFFIIYLLCLQTFRGVIYIESDATNLVISMFISIVSFVFWKRFGSDRLMQIIIFTLVISSVIIAVIGYVRILQFVSVARLQYASIAKNSLGQILLCQVILLFAFWNTFNKRNKILYSMALVILILVMFLLKSRATLLGLFFVIGYYMFRSGNRKTRISLIVIIAAAIIVIMCVPRYYEIIVENIILANRGNSDVDRISSGRVTLLAEHISLIPENLLWGIGAKYMDCFPVMQLVQFGLFGALIMLSYMVKIITIVLRLYKKETDNPAYVSLFLLLCVYLINSLFEAQAPFGPGVKCFILWMMFGFSIAQSSRVKRLINSDNESNKLKKI